MIPLHNIQRLLRRLVSIVVFVSVIFSASGQSDRKKIEDQMFSDTMGVSKSFQKTELQSHAFYDTMLNSKSWFVRTVASLLIGGRSSADDAYAIEESIVNEDYFSRFEGKIITTINIVNTNIFSRTEEDDISWLEKTIDKLHVKTGYDVIKKNLLFKIGQPFDAYTMAINEQYLRNKSYLSSAFFIITKDKKHPNGVVVNVFTKDNWTISVSGMLGSNPHGAIFDKNFIGTGNMLKFTYYPKTNNQYDAFEAEYYIDNIFGSFANASIRLGVGATNNTALVDVQRPYILPNDNIWGVKIGYLEKRDNMFTADSSFQSKSEEFSIYYGFTVDLKKNSGAIAYMTFSPSWIKYTKRINVDRYTNPFFTDRLRLMANIGISGQKFFQANMIYGYGRVEDIPYGYKFELTGGYENNLTLGERWYAGVLARYGTYTNAGYFDLTLHASTYIRNNGQFEQGQIGGQINYFSPLFSVKELYLRQFVTMTYTHGFNRLSGERESLALQSENEVRGMGTPFYGRGNSRLIVNTETVFFTPIFFYHFRFAFYGWFDMGWLGNNNIFYKNPFGSALGVGIRIKNERFIFNNIQLRFGVSLNRPAGSSFSWFDINNESALQIRDFAPKPASVTEFN